MTAAPAGPRMIGPEVVRAALTFDALVDPVADAFRASSAGRAQNGLIVMFPQSDRAAGDVYVKSAVIEDHPFYAVKVAPWFAANVKAGSPQGGFLAVFDARTGRTVALIEDEHVLSDLRTAAAGAVAARAFAPNRIATASVLGSGVQAYWQVRALHRERRVRTLNVWARDPAKAEVLADRLRADLPDLSIVACDREAAIRSAEVLLTATGARAPIVPGDWLRPGCHVTAVGADDPTKCELDAAALSRARVFVDERATAEATGDVHAAIATGGYAAASVAGEIGEVLDGRVPGRTSDDDITIATLSGIGAQDLAAVDVLLRKVNIR